MVELIKEKFGADAKDIEVEQDSYSDQGSGKNNLSPRDRLLVVFSRRERNMDKDNVVYPNVVDFVSELENLNVDEPMYCWNCSVGNNKWGGWATSKNIIYCLKR